ncbi:MAG: PKD domain-containing protein [Flavobacteriales bacterium]|nr:PKD domain-containing protein [Flavobacteriales bacterium]
MKRIFYPILCALLLILGLQTTEQASAQGTNYALTATATAGTPDANGLWNWNRINDGDTGTCGTQQAFVWTSGAYGNRGGTYPTDVWMQWTWSGTISINRLVIWHAQTTGRSLTGGMIQRWNGSAWVDHYNFKSPQSNCTNTIDFPVLTGDRVRITKIEMNGTGQLSNANYREIGWYVTTLGTNNAGVNKMTPLSPCNPTQALDIEIANMGTNRIDSVDINYTINGGAVKTVKYNRPYAAKDTLGSSRITKVVLDPSFKFTDNTSYNFKIWTSMPNGKQDTVNANDTLRYAFHYFGVPKEPTTYPSKQCGSGYPTLYGQSVGGSDIVWHDESNLELVLGIGDTSTLDRIYYPEGRYKFYGRAMSRAYDTMKNEFRNTWSYTGGTNPQDKGYFFDINTTYNVVMDGFQALLTSLGGGETVKADLYYKRGTHTGFETNSGAWTMLGSASFTATSLGSGPGGSNVPVMLDFPAIFLQENSTYGFYLMLRDVAQDFRTNCEQTANPRNGIGLSIAKGSLSAGTWSNQGYTGGFIPEIAFEYRYGCASDTVPNHVDVFPLAIGASMVKGSTFEGQYRGGNELNPDIVAEDSTVIYELRPPTNYPNSTFGKDWVITSLDIRTVNGTPISASDTSTSPISSSKNGALTYKPSKGWADSTIMISTVIRELKNNCDTLVTRYIYIAPTAEVDFEFTNGCLGTPMEFKNKSKLMRGFMRYEWDFGDGETTDFTDPIHNYAKHGRYNVTLVVTTDLGIKSSKTAVIDVFEIPNVSFRVQSACEGVAVKFINNTSISTGKIDYVWSFGDGQTSTQEQPSHLYSKPGGYRVTLVASSNGCASQLSKNANQFARPTADFSVTGACSGQPITINNRSTIELGEPIGSYWVMGDGNFDTDWMPEHAYAQSGTYQIKYMAISQFGCKDSITRSVQIKEGPNASFTYDKACDIDPVNFTNTSSEPNGANTVYSWTFGDGNSSTQKNPSHNYQRLGDKVVTLTASSDNGCSSETSQILTVKIQPQANFEVGNVCGNDPVNFVNTTEAIGATTFKWYFGDGDSSELTAPVHLYPVGQTQTYNVRLLASVENGCTDEFSKSVTVKEQPTCGFTAEQSSDNRATWTFTPNNTTYGASAYTWVLQGSRTYNQLSPTHTFEYTESEYRIILRVMTTEGCECMDSNTFITTAWTSGIREFSELGVSVYPNPTSGLVYIKSDAANSVLDVEVLDMKGESVMKLNQIAVPLEGREIDLNNLASGVYQLRMSNGETEAVHRVILHR